MLHDTIVDCIAPLTFFSMKWYKTSKKPSVSYKYRISAISISAWWLLCHCSIAIAVSWNEPLTDYTRTITDQPALYLVNQT